MDHDPSRLSAESGIRRWIATTDHKDIGTLYLVFAFLMLFVGGGMAMLIRAELFMPGLQFLDPDWYNNLVTTHALTMLLAVVLPAAVGMAYRMLPSMLEGRGMAFPRLGNFAFWLLPAGGLTLLLSMVAPALGAGLPANTGWTLYPPLSVRAGMGMDLVIVAIHILDLSSILASINIIATVANMRGPGMGWFRMPVFAWSWLCAALLLVMSMPVFSAAVTMLFLDRHFGTSFFSAAGGGDPVLFQHLFWFFGHPEVYVLLLPSIGIIALIIPTFSRKPLFGYGAIVGAMLGLTLLAVMVWAHHQYATGMSEAATRFFMLTTSLISIPVALIIINLVLTMWRGAISFETPMLFAIAFIVLFALGGFTGVMLASVPLDLQYHDSYFVVAHFHYTLIPGALFGLYAGIFLWLPGWTGGAYSERLARIFFWWVTISFNMTFLPQFFAGLAGMPRRIADYNMVFALFNKLSSIGAGLFGLAHLLLLYIVIETIRSGRKADARAELQRA